MKNKILKQTAREYAPRQRAAALFVEGLFFLGLLPFALVKLSSWLDQRLALTAFSYAPFNLIAGFLLVLGGGLLAVWTIYVQFTIGRGTPVPVMATQKLIVQRPYNECRNPMALGTIAAYLGIAVLMGSLSAVGLVLLGAIILLTYIKLAEEKEMELRFGESYQQYRRQTPFLIPRFWQRK